LLSDGALASAARGLAKNIALASDVHVLDDLQIDVNGVRRTRVANSVEERERPGRVPTKVGPVAGLMIAS
jgi:hypothetical protein